MTSSFPRTAALFAAIYVFLNPAFAVAPVPLPSPPSSLHPWLWKISGPQPSWLFGTVHSEDPRVATPPAAVVHALTASRSFHPEVELSTDVIASLALKLFTGDAPDLATRLSPALWRRTLKAADSLGLPEPLLHRLSPGLAALLFSTPPVGDIANTLDGRLYALAQNHGTAIAALETLDEQLAVFENLPVPDAVRLLAASLDESDQGRPGDNKLLIAYASGDERSLLTVLQAEVNRSPANRALAAPLLYRRNRVMADRLGPHLRRGGAFVAVGAAHLIGPGGLIELLRARGYSVSRVP